MLCVPIAHGQVSCEFFMTSGSSTPGVSWAVGDGFGNYYFAGSGNGGTTVIKTDSIGGLLWAKWFHYSGSVHRKGVAVLDGDLILATQRTHASSSLDAIIRRISADGGTLWERRIDLNGLSNVLNSVAVVHDTIVLAGRAVVDSLGFDLALVRLSEHGALISAVTLGTASEDLARWAEPAAGGGVFIVGETGAGGVAPTDILVVRVDADDNVVWSRRLDFGASESAWCAYVDPATGDCYLGGPYSDTGGNEVYYRSFITKLSAGGIHQWTRLLHGTFNIAGICAAGQGRFSAAATATETTGGHGSRDGLLVAFNSDGVLLGDRLYGTANSESIASFVTIEQGGTLLAGTSTSPERIYAVRIASEELEDACSGMQVPVAWQSVTPLVESVNCTKSAGFSIGEWSTPPSFWMVNHDFMCCPFPVNAEFSADPTENPLVWVFHSTSSGNGTLEWSFGGTESDVSHAFDSMGLHQVCLTISSPCDTATTCLDLLVSSTAVADRSPNGFQIYPQPADAGVWVSAPDPVLAVHVFAADGSIKRSIGQGSKEVWVPLADISSGLFWLRVHTARSIETGRLSIQR